jgi:hypothetical protein
MQIDNPSNFQLRKRILLQARSVKVLGGGNVFKVHVLSVGVKLFSKCSAPAALKFLTTSSPVMIFRKDSHILMN